MDIIINIKTSEQNDEQKDEEYIMNENLYIRNIQKQQDILIDYIMIDSDASDLKKRER